MIERGHLVAWTQKEFPNSDDRAFEVYNLILDFAQDYPDMVARCSYWELLSLAERRAA